MVGIAAIDPALDETRDVEGDHTVVLVGQIGKVIHTVVEITAGGCPRLPGDAALRPGGGHSINIGDLPCLVAALIEIQRSAGDGRIGRDGAQVKFEQTASVAAVIGADIERVVAAKVCGGGVTFDIGVV